MTDYPKDDLGNIRIDHVWGNMPMQPDEQRGENTLDPELDNHIIAVEGWANYPSFLPNYEGDGDVDFEVVVPNVRGMRRLDAEAALTNAGLDWSRTYVNPVIQEIFTEGSFAQVTIDDDYGFQIGDVVSGYYDDGDTVSGNFYDAVVTNVGGNGTALSVALSEDTPPELNITNAVNSSLFVRYVAGFDRRYVLRQTLEPDTIVDVNAAIDIFVLQDND